MISCSIRWRLPGETWSLRFREPPSRSDLVAAQNIGRELNAERLAQCSQAERIVKRVPEHGIARNVLASCYQLSAQPNSPHAKTGELLLQAVSVLGPTVERYPKYFGWPAWARCMRSWPCTKSCAANRRRVSRWTRRSWSVACRGDRVDGAVYIPDTALTRCWAERRWCARTG